MPLARGLLLQGDNHAVGVASNVCTLNGREMPELVFLGAEAVQVSAFGPKQLTELVTSLLPVARHVLLRRPSLAGLPFHIQYIDPNQSLSENANGLRKFLDSIQNTRSVWMPISGNASLMLHTMRQVLPNYGKDQLALLSLLYVGEAALNPLLHKLAKESGMDFSFHALY